MDIENVSSDEAADANASSQINQNLVENLKNDKSLHSKISDNLVKYCSNLYQKEVMGGRKTPEPNVVPNTNSYDNKENQFPVSNPEANTNSKFTPPKNPASYYKYKTKPLHEISPLAKSDSPTTKIFKIKNTYNSVVSPRSQLAGAKYGENSGNSSGAEISPVKKLASICPDFLETFVKGRIKQMLNKGEKLEQFLSPKKRVEAVCSGDMGEEVQFRSSQPKTAKNLEECTRSSNTLVSDLKGQFIDNEKQKLMSCQQVANFENDTIKNAELVNQTSDARSSSKKTNQLVSIAQTEQLEKLEDMVEKTDLENKRLQAKVGLKKRKLNL